MLIIWVLFKAVLIYERAEETTPGLVIYFFKAIAIAFSSMGSIIL